MFECEKCERKFSNKGGFASHVKSCKLNSEIKQSIINDYCNHNYALRDLEKKYSINKSLLSHVLKNRIRSISESVRICHLMKPNSFKHSEATKSKLRDIRLKWMKENPEKTAWRQSNLSYPEKLFLDKIYELGLDKKYLIVREKSIFPFFIDFAFENEKVAVEIDGSQHTLEDRKKMDNKKDELLKDLGWVVYRVTAKEIQKNINGFIEKLLNVLGGGSLDNTGLFLEKTQKQKEMEKKFNKMSEERKKNGGYTDLQILTQINQRRVDRPTYQTLIQEIGELGYVGTGKKYGVSDNAIRAWKKYYEKNSKLSFDRDLEPLAGIEPATY